jgi:hypothetical protein
MPILNQVISDVRQSLNRVNFDGYIPAKFLHSKLLDAAKLFVKREADDRRFYLYPDIWVTINNFELESTPLIGCSEIAVPNCSNVMKAKIKLPEIYTTRYGYLINISSIDYTRNYIQTTPKDYAKIKSRRFQNPGLRYFWIYNGYLVIPDAMVQSVTIRAMFCDKAQGLRIEACGDNGCIKTLEQDFTVPGHLLDNVKDYTVMKIAGIKDKIPTDTYPNLNDLEKKSPVSK